MRFEFSKGSSQRCFSEENELRKALSFYGLHPPFSVGVQVGASRRLGAQFAISVHNSPVTPGLEVSYEPFENTAIQTHRLSQLDRSPRSRPATECRPVSRRRPEISTLACGGRDVGAEVAVGETSSRRPEP